MKNTFFFLLFIIFFASFSPQTSYAQFEYRNGFIIKSNNDTISGEVLHIHVEKGYEVCTFRNGEDVTVYKPTEIKGYGYSDGLAFVSGIVDTAFVEILVDGYLSLYEYKKNFFVRKDGEVAQVLEYKKIKIERKGKIVTGKDESWKDSLALIMSDCREMLTRTYKLERGSLIETIVAYNECMGEDYKKLKKGKNQFKVDLGLGFGYTQTSLKLTNVNPDYKNLNADYNGLDPTIFFDVGFSLSRTPNILSIHTGINYLKSSFSFTRKVDSYNVDNYYDSYINYDHLSIPVYFQYSVPFKKSTFAFDGGISFENYLSPSATLHRDRIYKNNGPTKVELINSSFASFAEEQMSYLMGFNIRRKYSFFSVQAGLRYTIQASQLVPYVISESANFKSSVKRLSLSLNVIW